jgi:glyoxylase-like metal-dependent hydrolase (beta-lactamase superfamily II)
VSYRSTTISAGDITDVFLTHIHLDHAGASGWLARQGARIHLHPNGAPHMLNPEKLIASATRIYGEQMGPLWGEFLPVPEERLSILQDGQVVQINELSVRAIEVPGHANHHYAYLVGDICFSGDIGGVRLHGLRYICLPTPPPDLHLEKWRASIQRLQAEKPARIAPTHFGVYNDAEWHLAAVTQLLDEVTEWAEQVMPADPPIEELRRMFIEFERQRTIKNGLTAEVVDALQIANPSFMSADGIQRY